MRPIGFNQNGNNFEQDCLETKKCIIRRVALKEIIKIWPGKIDTKQI